MCGLRLRFAPRPFLDFGGHPTVTSYPFRFSITPAMAPCLPRLALSFIEPCAHPVCCQGGGDNPPCALFSLFAAGPSSVAVAVVCGPPSSRGTYILGDGTAYVQSNLGTGFGSGGQSCAVWPKTGQNGAIGTKPARFMPGGPVRRPDLPLTWYTPMKYGADGHQHGWRGPAGERRPHQRRDRIGLFQ